MVEPSRYSVSGDEFAKDGILKNRKGNSLCSFLVALGRIELPFTG